MFGFKNFRFKNAAPPHLPADLRAAVEAWRASSPLPLDEPHFHVRYVVIDIASTGTDAEQDPLLGIAAAGVRHAGSVGPDDAFYLDFSRQAFGESDDAAVERQLMALLQYTAKAPLVTYHVPYVSAFLQRACQERLGIDFQPQWVDLAWLLPSMFDEMAYSLLTLDQWLELFGLDSGAGRRSTMENTLMLARLFQMLLVRANGKGIDTAARLIDESQASSFLRRTH